MGIKENFAQAVRELTGANAGAGTPTPGNPQENEAAAKSTGEAGKTQYSPSPAVPEYPIKGPQEPVERDQLNMGAAELRDYDSSPQKVANPVSFTKEANPPAPEPAVYPYAAGQNNAPQGERYSGAASYPVFGGNNGQAGGVSYSPPLGGISYSPRATAPVPPPRYDDDELTIISKNTVIDGNIRSFANMSIDGDIKGDVETTKNIDLNGKIVGNLTCNNAEMHTSQIQGNIRMKGNIEMERDTLLIGDLVSTYAKVNGKIKGNLDISGRAELKGDAVVFGDISASTITVDDGAIIQGYVSTTFLNKDESRNIFPDTISIDN